MCPNRDTGVWDQRCLGVVFRDEWVGRCGNRDCCRSPPTYRYRCRSLCCRVPQTRRCRESPSEVSGAVFVGRRSRCCGSCGRSGVLDLDLGTYCDRLHRHHCLLPAERPSEWQVLVTLAVLLCYGVIRSAQARSSLTRGDISTTTGLREKIRCHRLDPSMRAQPGKPSRRQRMCQRFGENDSGAEPGYFSAALGSPGEVHGTMRFAGCAPID